MSVEPLAGKYRMYARGHWEDLYRKEPLSQEASDIFEDVLEAVEWLACRLLVRADRRKKLLVSDFVGLLELAFADLYQKKEGDED